MTKIVNIYGAPGAGKSTLGAELYAYFKGKQVKCELCMEYVKSWAYDNKAPSKYDQFYIFGKEVYHLTRLLGKVDYIICDSPVMIGNYYLAKAQGAGLQAPTILDPVIKQLNELIENDGHQVHDIFFFRTKAYIEAGRYQTAEESDAIGKELYSFLTAEHRLGDKLLALSCPDASRLTEVLNILGA